jgi:ribose 5-phosphate isomerase B
MKIACGADHAGFELKGQLVSWLLAHGHEVLDCGTLAAERCDYPDFAQAVSRAIATGEVERGLLVCGTGIGMAIAANRHPSVRAVVGTDLFSVGLARAHNDANCLALGARVVAPAHGEALLEQFLTASFEGGRHSDRIAKMTTP